MTHEIKTKPDAFKAVMAAAKHERAGSDLPHQSLGRELTKDEEALADALMSIYASGASGPAAVAAALAERGVRSPSSGSTEWTAAGLANELAALNADLDSAYQDNGFGG